MGIVLMPAFHRLGDLPFRLVIKFSIHSFTHSIMFYYKYHNEVKYESQVSTFCKVKILRRSDAGNCMPYHTYLKRKMKTRRFTHKLTYPQSHPSGMHGKARRSNHIQHRDSQHLIKVQNTNNITIIQNWNTQTICVPLHWSFLPVKPTGMAFRKLDDSLITLYE